MCHARKPLIETWTKKLLLEEFSQIGWGYKNLALLAERREAATRGGPGYYDVSDEFLKKCSFNVSENFSFGKNKRFHEAIKHKNPGPGAYGIPHTKSEVKNKPLHQWTPVSTFEWGGLKGRFDKLKRPWELPCNRYDMNINGIASISNKVVSKKGPYNLFTGPRDNTTIKGYFALPKVKVAKSRPKVLPHCFDYLLLSKYKARTGKFFKSQRFVERESKVVTDFYNLARPKVFKQNKYPFNSSVAYPRPQKGRQLHPGPWRYETKHATCTALVPEQFARSWQFKSTIQRTKYETPHYNAF